MGTGLTRARTGAAIVGASATALLVTALPASAATSGKLDSSKDTYGYTVHFKDHKPVKTNLMNLNTGSSALDVYCIEIEHNATAQRTMVEHDWDDYPNEDSPFYKKDENRHKINWVLHNAYPEVDADDLADAVEDAGDWELHDGLTEKEALTATQAAIWHYSDGVDIARDNSIHGDKASSYDVRATYDYLTGDANTGNEDQPNPSLEIDPDDATGNAGEEIGPFTISSNGDVEVVENELPDGTTLTDSDGNELDEDDADKVLGGEEFYLNIPKDADAGDAEFKLKADTQVGTGRLFVVEDYDEKAAQSLIVASSEKTSAEASATVSWEAAKEETTPPESSESETPSTSETQSESAAPATSSKNNNKASGKETENLAYTGASVITPVAVGVGLLAVGGIALFLVRRRQKA